MGFIFLSQDGKNKVGGGTVFRRGPVQVLTWGWQDQSGPTHSWGAGLPEGIIQTTY